MSITETPTSIVAEAGADVETLTSVNNTETYEVPYTAAGGHKIILHLQNTQTKTSNAYIRASDFGPRKGEGDLTIQLVEDTGQQAVVLDEGRFGHSDDNYKIDFDNDFLGFISAYELGT